MRTSPATQGLEAYLVLRLFVEGPANSACDKTTAEMVTAPTNTLHTRHTLHRTFIAKIIVPTGGDPASESSRANGISVDAVLSLLTLHFVNLLLLPPTQYNTSSNPVA